MSIFFKVVVVTVTYGDRFNYVEKLINSVINDRHLEKIIIVNNGSQQTLSKLSQIENNISSKIKNIFFEKNLGSAIAFAKGLEEARKENVSHVLLLDDDNIPEENALTFFLEHLTHFYEHKKIVLCGNRHNLVGNDKYFFEYKKNKELYTFFDIFNFSKIKKYLHLDQNDIRKSKEILENASFAYGGTLLPIEAVREISLPDTSFVLYGDDIEYSWRIKKAGYKTYVCKRPYINDIDLTFGEADHITGLFQEQTKPFKVFYRIRNMVYASVKHSLQTKVSLYINMFSWFLFLFIIGAKKTRMSKLFWLRSKLIMKAIRSGFYPNLPIPEEVSLP